MTTLVRRPPVGLTVGAAAVAVAFTGPLAYLVVRNADDVTGFVEVVTAESTLGPLQRTLSLAATVTLACAVVGTLMAWLVVRSDLRGRRVIGVAAALPLVLPSFVAALALIAAFARGGLLEELLGIDTGLRIEGWWAAFTVLTLISYPYVYLPVAARLAGLPRSLEESAAALGRSRAKVFATIVMPQIAGAVVAGSLLVFLYCVSEFGAVALVDYDTLTRRIYAARLLDQQAALAMSLLLGAVAIAVVAVERAVTRRRARVEAPGSRSPVPRTRLGAWTVPAYLFVVVVVGLGLVAPVLVLARWALRGMLGEQGVIGQETGLAELVEPTVTTAGLGVVSALVAIAVVLPVAYLAGRYRARTGGVATALVVGGFALPGLVIALALVSWTLRAPIVDRLYQTVPLLVFAYVVHFGAQALGASRVSVETVPSRLHDAARALGASRVRRFTSVDLPLMVPGLAAAGGLVLLSVLKELPTTLLLAPIGIDTLALRIWSAAEEGFFARAGLASIVLVAISAVLTWFLTIRHSVGVRAARAPAGALR